MNNKWKQISELSSEKSRDHSSSTWEKEYKDFSAIVVVGTMDRGNQKGRGYFIWSTLHHNGKKVINTKDEKVKRNTAIKLAMEKIQLIDNKINYLQNLSSKK